MTVKMIFRFMIILLNLPAVIVMTIPMSVLFATVMTINKMCLQSEFTILKACGISLNRISKSIFIFGIVMALVTFIINETIVPVTTAQSKTLALYSIVQRNIPEGKKNFTIKELKTKILQLEKKNKEQEQKNLIYDYKIEKLNQ